MLLLAGVLFFIAESEPSEHIRVFLSPVLIQKGDTSLAGALEERLTLELENSRFFSLVPPRLLEDSVPCSGLDCATAHARDAGADFLFFTSLSSFETLHTVTVRLVELESGNSVHTLVEDVQGTSEEMLLDGPKDLVQRLDALIEASRKIPVKFNSTPEGAAILLGGEIVGITPYADTIGRAGEYVVRIEKDGYAPQEDTLALVDGKLFEKSWTLVRSQEWIDSVAAARRDSILQAAQRNMKNSLPEALTLITVPLGAREGMRIAVLPFETGENAVEEGAMVAEYAVSWLFSQPGVTVVERENFQKLIDEQILSLSGIISESSELEIGHMLSANYLLTGRVTTFNQTRTVFMRLVSVESGEIIAASAAQLNEEVTSRMMKEVFGERLQPSAAAFRSLVVPGWGQSYTGNRTRAIVWTALCAGAAGVTTYLGLNLRNKNDQLEKYKLTEPSTIKKGENPEQWAARATAIQKERNTAADYFNYALIGTGAVWIANIVDAAVLGRIQSKNIKKLYFSAVPTQNSDPTLLVGITISF
ncbi:hypothetical protein CHISP_3483 [Chitinispirillum alkaliphilum]|nr:hypothetical protein CHISP_3483 [Chitinispirillum alkaliphilum]